MAISDLMKGGGILGLAAGGAGLLTIAFFPAALAALPAAGATAVVAHSGTAAVAGGAGILGGHALENKI